ncbi:conserved hypothetical protein [Candidatus Magnetomoraceae bacterium gMMP-15]
MAKIFRPSRRESRILSEIESAKFQARKKSITSIKDHLEDLSNALAMKLVENEIIETDNKSSIEEQLTKCLKKMTHAEDFDIDYQIAPLRNLIKSPNVVSLYITSYVLEQLINHRDVVDIFGSDEDIYYCINKQVNKFLS